MKVELSLMKLTLKVRIKKATQEDRVLDAWNKYCWLVANPLVSETVKDQALDNYIRVCNLPF